MASKKPLHPLVDAALRKGAEIGGKAVTRAAREGIGAGLDSVLEDAEKAAGRIVGRTKDAREKVRRGFGVTPREADVKEDEEETAGEEEEEEEEDSEEEEAAEEDDDPEELTDEERLVYLCDAATALRFAMERLEELSDDKRCKKLLDRVEIIHDELDEVIDEES